MGFLGEQGVVRNQVALINQRSSKVITCALQESQPISSRMDNIVSLCGATPGQVKRIVTKIHLDLESANQHSRRSTNPRSPQHIADTKSSERFEAVTPRHLASVSTAVSSAVDSGHLSTSTSYPSATRGVNCGSERSASASDTYQLLVNTDCPLCIPSNWQLHERRYIRHIDIASEVALAPRIALDIFPLVSVYQHGCFRLEQEAHQIEHQVRLILDPCIVDQFHSSHSHYSPTVLVNTACSDNIIRAADKGNRLLRLAQEEDHQDESLSRLDSLSPLTLILDPCIVDQLHRSHYSRTVMVNTACSDNSIRAADKGNRLLRLAQEEDYQDEPLSRLDSLSPPTDALPHPQTGGMGNVRSVTTPVIDAVALAQSLRTSPRQPHSPASSPRGPDNGYSRRQLLVKRNGIVPSCHSNPTWIIRVTGGDTTPISTDKHSLFGTSLIAQNYSLSILAHWQIIPPHYYVHYDDEIPEYVLHHKIMTPIPMLVVSHHRGHSRYEIETQRCSDSIALSCMAEQYLALLITHDGPYDTQSELTRADLAHDLHRLVDHALGRMLDDETVTDTRQPTSTWPSRFSAHARTVKRENRP